jgi:hypothetical protein
MKTLSAYLPAAFSLALPLWLLCSAFAMEPGKQRIETAEAFVDGLAASAVLFSATGLVMAATRRPELN